MVKSELIKRSPLRILEKSIHGGLGKGNIGVLAAKKGVGKTACLVHIATDKLLQDRHVIHVSFSSKVDHIINWYEDIFKEIAKKRHLEAAVTVHDEIIRNRVIMNFNQTEPGVESVLKSVAAMIKDGGFKADVVVIDGYNFEKSKPEELAKISAFAKENGIEVWISASLKVKEPFSEKGYPVELKDFDTYFSVIVSMKYSGDRVKLTLVKDHDVNNSEELHLMLDPKTLLLAEE
jgi:hypothetical protein